MENLTLEFLFSLVLGLAITAPGGTALLVFILNFLKAAGVIKDDKAQVAFNLLNLLFVVTIGLIMIFVPGFDYNLLDTKLVGLASTLMTFLPVLSLIIKWLGPLFYQSVRGVPILGYSHSLPKG